MEIVSKIHGKISYKKEDVINFAKGLPGFNNLKKYVLVELDEYKPFKILQAIEDSEVGLIVMSPFNFVKNYEIKLSNELLRNLKIENEKDVMVLTTITLNSDVNKITTNLRGPIIINTQNLKGEQIVLDNPEYETKYNFLNKE